MKKLKNHLQYVLDFLKLLMRKDIPFSSFEIIIYTLQSLNKNNHLYQFLLKQYDPSIQFIEYDNAKFIANGGGDESLNLYRKIIKGDSIVFEKIYRIDAREFKNALYFYENIYNQITDLGILVPKLQYKFIGKKLACMYYEFIEIDKNETRKGGFDFFKLIDEKMKQISPKRKGNLEEFQLFTSSSTYQRGKEKMIQDFPIEERNFAKQAFKNLEVYFLQHELYFQHIDLHHNNVINYKYLIDWDTASYYPPNYDYGTFASWKLLEELKEQTDNYPLFVNKVMELNQKRDLNFEFSLLMHFVRFYPQLNFSTLFGKYYNDYKEIFKCSDNQ